jgi:hypothetical protein
MAAAHGCAPHPAPASTDLPRHRSHPAARLPGDAARPLTPKLWCLKPKMACKPLMTNIVQIETAEVGSNPGAAGPTGRRI